jgi:hypothetical protein
MSDPLCLNHPIFLIMNNKIKNAVVRLGIIDGLLRSLFVPCVPCVLYDPFHKTNLMHTVAYSKHFKPAAQPIVIQLSTQFQAKLNTIEHELCTHPYYGPLKSLASLWSLRSLLSHRVFQLNLKTEHKKTRKNTQRRKVGRSG